VPEEKAENDIYYRYSLKIDAHWDTYNFLGQILVCGNPCLEFGVRVFLRFAEVAILMLQLGMSKRASEMKI